MLPGQSHTNRHGKLLKIVSEFTYKIKRTFQYVFEDKGYRSACLEHPGIAPGAVLPWRGRATRLGRVASLPLDACRSAKPRFSGDRLSGAEREGDGRGVAVTLALSLPQPGVYT